MKFKDALELMKQGLPIKRPHWSGHWLLESGNVMMHCRDGKVINLQNTEDIVYTLSNIAEEDWIEAK